MSNDGGEAFAWLAIVIVGLGLLLVIGAVYAIAWIIFAAIAREARRQRLMAKAGEDFDYTLGQEGLTIPPEDAADVLFAGGLDLKPTGGLDAFDVLVYAAGDGQEAGA